MEYEVTVFEEPKAIVPYSPYAAQAMREREIFSSYPDDFQAMIFSLNTLSVEDWKKHSKEWAKDYTEAIHTLSKMPSLPRRIVAKRYYQGELVNSLTGGMLKEEQRSGGMRFRFGNGLHS